MILERSISALNYVSQGIGESVLEIYSRSDSIGGFKQCWFGIGTAFTLLIFVSVVVLRTEEEN